MTRWLWSLALVLLSCAAPVAAQQEGAADVSATIFVSEGGMVRPLTNGARVPLEGGGWATVSFSPFPPREDADLEVALDGVGAAEVTVICEMVGMDHGSTKRAAVALGHRFRAPLSFPMPGAYRVVIEVGGTAARSTLVLVVSAG